MLRPARSRDRGSTAARYVAESKGLRLSSDDVLLRRFQQAQQELVLQPADLSLRTIATMVGSGAIDIAPRFQRRERWDRRKQVALIESFLLNIPVPPIYLAEEDLGVYSVIDGKQRITAITSFLNDQLEMRSAYQLPEFEGLTFSGLPRQVRGALDVRPLRSVTILKQSHPDLKFEVFHRLNSGGEILNAQEIRNVVYRGPLNELVYELAGNPALRERLKIRSDSSPAYRKMMDAEYVLRFLTLSEWWGSFSGDLAWSMNRFMETNRHARDNQLAILRSRFERAMNGSMDLWGSAAFKRPEGSVWRDQALAGMYDAQMIAVSELDDDHLDLLRDRSGLVVAGTRALFDDGSFDAAVRQATNTPSRVVYRIDRMKDLLLSVSEK